EPLWTPSEPWGYTTCHYGRWNWADNLGWLWYPGNTWGPSWVRWASTPNYLLWAPLNPWGQPVFGGNPISTNSLLLNTLAWSMSGRTNFLARSPATVLALGRAPRFVDVRRVTVVRDPVVLVRELPRVDRIRGLRQVAWTSLAAPQRVAILERR